MSNKPFFTILVIVAATVNFNMSNPEISTSPDIREDDNSFIAVPHRDGILKLSIRSNTLLPGIQYSDRLNSISTSSLTFDWTSQTFFHLVNSVIRIVPFNVTHNPIKLSELAIVKTVKAKAMTCYFEHVDRYLYVFYNSDKSVTRFDPYTPSGDDGEDLVLKLGERDVISTLIVDPCESMMYWTNVGRDDFIQRASTAGLNQNIETILGERGLLPRWLTIDPFRRELYWTDHDGVVGRIERSDLHGENRMIVVKNRREERGIYQGIAVTKDFIYYRANYSVNLYRADRNGMNGIRTEINLNGRLNRGNGMEYVNRQIDSRNQCVWRFDLHHWNSQNAKEMFTFGLGQQNRTLSCVYTMASDDTRVKWLHNNIDLDLTSFRTMSSVLGGKSESLLTIKKVRLSDEGNYTCEVWSGIFEESVHFMVLICSSCVPKIDKSESRRVFSEGTGAQFLTCKYNTTSQPNVTWTHNGQTMLESFSTYNGTTGESFIQFINIDLNDDGIYTCSVVNEFGEDFFEINMEEHVEELMEEPVEGARGNELIFPLTGSGTVILVIILILGFMWRKHIAKKSIIKLTDREVKEFYEGKPEAQVSNPNDCGNITALAMPFDQKNEMSLENLIIENGAPLGQGQFGLVRQGSYQDRAVAVKTVKPNSDVAYLKALLSEIKIMAFIENHKGIVQFLGANTSRIQENVVYLVVELSPIGDLHSYLQRNRPAFLENFDKFTEGVNDNFKCPMSQKNFVNWSLQIADGMKYLEEKKVVHADLATRNVLMFPRDVVKISDFGLSRQLYGYTKYIKKSKSPLPLQWMALESLRFMEFTSQSDVWSFGVTIWEIFSLGQVPYPEFTWSANFVQLLVQGLRLTKPDHATAEIYEEMLKCWHRDPEKRPTFTQLLDFFQSLPEQPNHPNLSDATSLEGRYIESEVVSAYNRDERRSNDDLSEPLHQCLVFSDNNESVETGVNTAIYLSI